MSLNDSGEFEGKEAVGVELRVLERRSESSTSSRGELGGSGDECRLRSLSIRPGLSQSRNIFREGLDPGKINAVFSGSKGTDTVFLRL